MRATGAQEGVRGVRSEALRARPDRLTGEASEAERHEAAVGLLLPRNGRLTSDVDRALSTRDGCFC